MISLTVSVYWEKKGICPCFLSHSTLFFICIIFKKESPGTTGRLPGETRGDRGRPEETGETGGETGGDQDLQLVPGRDNIGDVGL